MSDKEPKLTLVQKRQLLVLLNDEEEKLDEVFSSDSVKGPFFLCAALAKWDELGEKVRQRLKDAVIRSRADEWTEEQARTWSEWYAKNYLSFNPSTQAAQWAWMSPRIARETQQSEATYTGWANGCVSRISQAFQENPIATLELLEPTHAHLESWLGALDSLEVFAGWANDLVTVDLVPKLLRVYFQLAGNCRRQGKCTGVAPEKWVRQLWREANHKRELAPVLEKSLLSSGSDSIESSLDELWDEFKNHPHTRPEFTVAFWSKRDSICVRAAKEELEPLYPDAVAASQFFLRVHPDQAWQTTKWMLEHFRESHFSALCKVLFEQVDREVVSVRDRLLPLSEYASRLKDVSSAMLQTECEDLLEKKWMKRRQSIRAVALAEKELAFFDECDAKFHPRTARLDVEARVIARDNEKKKKEAAKLEQKAERERVRQEREAQNEKMRQILVAEQQEERAKIERETQAQLVRAQAFQAQQMELSAQYQEKCAEVMRGSGSPEEKAATMMDLQAELQRQLASLMKKAC